VSQGSDEVNCFFVFLEQNIEIKFIYSWLVYPAEVSQGSDEVNCFLVFLEQNIEIKSIYSWLVARFGGLKINILKYSIRQALQRQVSGGNATKWYWWVLGLNQGQKD
jgi:hypothetical protein